MIPHEPTIIVWIFIEITPFVFILEVGIENYALRQICELIVLRLRLCDVNVCLQKTKTNKICKMLSEEDKILTKISR